LAIKIAIAKNINCPLFLLKDLYKESINIKHYDGLIKLIVEHPNWSLSDFQ